jgi:DNA-binding NarL/FixJ family response regulator
MAASIRVAIADDHALFRQGLRSMLRLQSDVSVVAEVERASDVLPMLEQVRCDVLLLDLQMERSVLADIEMLGRHVAVLVVTASERVEDARAAIAAGARGIVYKRFAIEMLMSAVRAVAEGHVWMPPALQAAMASWFRQPAAVSLTRREREVVRHVALGLRNAEVAALLHIGEPTVKTHVNNVFHKLGLRDRVELALYAIRNGIVGVHERRV